MGQQARLAHMRAFAGLNPTCVYCFFPVFIPVLTRSPSPSAINGILAMQEFKDKFGRKSCLDNKGKQDICAADSSLIVAILSAGTVVGALLAAPLCDSIGRRKALLLAVGIFCIGAIFQVCAQAVDMLLVGRYVVPAQPVTQLVNELSPADCYQVVGRRRRRRHITPRTTLSV